MSKQNPKNLSPKDVVIRFLGIHLLSIVIVISILSVLGAMSARVYFESIKQDQEVTSNDTTRIEQEAPDERNSAKESSEEENSNEGIDDEGEVRTLRKTELEIYDESEDFYQKENDLKEFELEDIGVTVLYEGDEPKLEKRETFRTEEYELAYSIPDRQDPDPVRVWVSKLDKTKKREFLDFNVMRRNQNREFDVGFINGIEVYDTRMLNTLFIYLIPVQGQESYISISFDGRSSFISRDAPYLKYYLYQFALKNSLITEFTPGVLYSVDNSEEGQLFYNDKIYNEQTQRFEDNVISSSENLELTPIQKIGANRKHTFKAQTYNDKVFIKEEDSLIVYNFFTKELDKYSSLPSSFEMLNVTNENIIQLEWFDCKSMACEINRETPERLEIDLVNLTATNKGESTYTIGGFYQQLEAKEVLSDIDVTCDTLIVTGDQDGIVTERVSGMINRANTINRFDQSGRVQIDIDLDDVGDEQRNKITNSTPENPVQLTLTQPAMPGMMVGQCYSIFQTKEVKI